MTNPLVGVGFAALWHPELLLAALLVGIAYIQVTGRLRARFEGGAPVPPGKSAAFLGGLLVLYLAQGSPLEILSNEYLFTAHIVQTILLLLVAPPLLLMGTPAWLVRPLFRAERVRRVVRGLTSPVTATVIFVAVFSAYLDPSITESALNNGWLYLLQHALSFVAALILWWPVLSPLPELPPLSDPLQLLYTFCIELGMTVAFALITFAGTPLYPTFAAAPRVLALTPLQDQELGGLVMRLGSMASFGVAFAVAFFRWFRSDSRLAA
ncbi:MAG TPA: cytochrome c oxidase assembly protein [Bacillota bacterium]|nr:cytochrome c oxidase assembly protein [Bacillota bacterium]